MAQAASESSRRRCSRAAATPRCTSATATATAASRTYYTSFEGVIPFLERRHAEAESETSRERYEGYMREVPCPTCNGARLKPESLAVTLGDRTIAEVAGMSHRRLRCVPPRARALTSARR